MSAIWFLNNSRYSSCFRLARGLMSVILLQVMISTFQILQVVEEADVGDLVVAQVQRLQVGAVLQVAEVLAGVLLGAVVVVEWHRRWHRADHVLIHQVQRQPKAMSG